MAPSRRQTPRCRHRFARWPCSTWRELRNDTFDVDFNALVDQLHGRMPGDVVRELDWWDRVKAAAAAWPIATFAVTLLTLLAAWSGALDVLHIDTHVQRLLLAAGAPNAGEPVLLVGIDAASERELRRSFAPIDNAAAWRRDHARLIDRAARAGARAVVFDIFFERETDADGRLADAARRAAAAADAGGLRRPPSRRRSARTCASRCAKRVSGVRCA